MNIFSVINQFKQNPLAVLTQRFNIPQNMSNPQDIIQHLINTNQVSQAQVNQAMQMKNNPMFRQLLK